jgi:hypothetical protein
MKLEAKLLAAIPGFLERLAEVWRQHEPVLFAAKRKALSVVPDAFALHFAPNPLCPWEENPVSKGRMPLPGQAAWLAGLARPPRSGFVLSDGVNA